MAGSRSVAAATRPPRDQAVPRPTTDTGLDLLATKLTLPRTSLSQVPRPRLFDLLNAGTQQLLTLVSAPAGAGKTTVLASWSSSRQPPGPVAWLSLDAGDNEAGRFWAYAVAALCQSGAVPAAGGRAGRVGGRAGAAAQAAEWRSPVRGPTLGPAVETPPRGWYRRG